MSERIDLQDRGTWASPLSALVLLALLSVSLLVPLPVEGRVKPALLDLVHAPAFAVLAAVTYSVARRRWLIAPWLAALGVWLALSLFGALSEVAQSYTGRSASWHDAASDALGVAAGVAVMLGLEAAALARRMAWCLVGLSLLAAAQFDPLIEIWDSHVQQTEFPVLATFEHVGELGRWWTQNCLLSLDAPHATEGGHALRLDLEPGLYPGIAIEDAPRDWSEYDALLFDVELPASPGGSAGQTPPPLELTVKIQDSLDSGQVDDRFNGVYPLQPGRREIRIPLSEVAAAPHGRRLDLHSVARLDFFTANLSQPRTLYLDNIRLVRHLP